MKYHRFIGNFDLDNKKVTVTDENLLSQWRNVLRFKTGDLLILCDGNGNESEAMIENIDKKQSILSLNNTQKIIRGTNKEVVLFASILRRENFELVVQKATEIGVSKIVPLLSVRTVKTGFNKARLEKILMEASEQSGRTILPQLNEPMSFAEAIESVDSKETILFDGSGKELNNSDVSSDKINIFIGPEGGWGPEEIQIAKDKNVKILSLGSLTLRAETAAIAVSFLACLK